MHRLTDEELAQVRRDAAREALDGLAALCRYTAAKRMKNRESSRVTQVVYRTVERYRDHNYPKETP